LLERALIHPSLSNEERQQHRQCHDQEALRVLGDAVLKTIVSERLIHAKYETKGDITIKKSENENRKFLAQIGQKFDLASSIRVGAGAKDQKHHEQPDVIAETLEAIIGAIYLDGGFDIVKRVILKWYPSEKFLGRE
jgi:ribonuclease III